MQSGDALTGLAKKYYGDLDKYMIIYEANKEVIGHDTDPITDGLDIDWIESLAF